MGDQPTARLSIAARKAIHSQLSNSPGSTAVPISKILREIRSDVPELRKSDEELIDQIVMEATDYGLAVHFDQERDVP